MKRSLFSSTLVFLCTAGLLFCACNGSDECSEGDGGTSCPDSNCPDTEPPPPASDIGSVCAYHTDCSEFCMIGLSGMAPYCTRSCETANCPAGFFCLSAGQMGMICIMGGCGDDADCPARYTCDLSDPDNQVCIHADIGCQIDDDCPAATACNQGLCQLYCESHDDCKQGYFCEWQRRCVLCTGDGHCNNGFSCEDGNCNEACVWDEHCRNGFECNEAGCDKKAGGGTGEFDAGCEDDGDCVEFCHDYYCNTTCEGEGDTESCPPGFYCHSSHLICYRE